MTTNGNPQHEGLSLNYLNSYVDTLEAMPIELSRHFHDLRELDAVLSSSAENINHLLKRLSATIENDDINQKDRFIALRDASEEIKQYKLGAEDKIRLATTCCESTLAHTEYIDNVLLHFLLHDPSLFPPPPIYPPSGTNLQRMTARALLSLSPNGINGRRRMMQNNPYAYETNKKRRLIDQQSQQSAQPSSSGGNVMNVTASSNGRHSHKRVPQMTSSRGVNKRNDSPMNINSPANSDYYSNKATTVRQIEKSSQRRTNNGKNLYSPPPSPYSATSMSTGGIVGYDSHKFASNNNGLNYEGQYDYIGDPSFEEGDQQPTGGNEDVDEARYCYCNGVSYGQMIGCDDEQCAREWFHIGCVGLDKPPSGTWICEECLIRRRMTTGKKRGRKA